MKKESLDREYYFLKSIERIDGHRFSVGVCSQKGHALTWVLIKESVVMGNGDHTTLYKCQEDEDSRIFSRDLYDIRSLMKAIEAFDAATELAPEGPGDAPPLS